MTKPVLLIILDGWGYREEHEGNAIAQASTPCWDSLWAQQPHTLISASGLDVGLPDGQMGNSEVGHMTIGSGRTIHQDLTRINLAIKEGTFQNNTVLNETAQQAVASNKTIHVAGLLSPGGVHSHQQHIFELLKQLDTQGCQVQVHAILDGRDTPPKSAQTSIEKLETLVASLPRCKIATVSGRYYAMDRDKRFERIEKAYQAIVKGKAKFNAATASEALAKAYTRNETDEFVQPTCLGNYSTHPMQDQDYFLFMNFRADRARQLCQVLTDTEFTLFNRGNCPKLTQLITLTEYDPNLHATVAFPKPEIHNTLGEYLSQQQIKQFRIAETEKYAHVTFFFNCGKEQPFPGEQRVLIPSPKVATYDLQPEMSAASVCNTLCEAVTSKRYQFLVCNFANPDMIGHTGNFDAAIKAVETIDTALKQIVTTMTQVDGHLLITADHGNVEMMLNQAANQPHTSHTNQLVPLVYLGSRQQVLRSSGGTLADLAPTILDLLAFNKPPEMTGQSLLIT